MRKFPEIVALLTLLLLAVWLARECAWFFASDFAHQTAPLRAHALLPVRRALAAAPPSLAGDLLRVGETRPALLFLAALFPSLPLLGFLPPLRRTTGGCRFGAASLRALSLVVLAVGVAGVAHRWLDPPSTLLYSRAWPTPRIHEPYLAELAVLRISLLLALAGNAGAVVLDGVRTGRSPG